ncbi:putative DNA helicase INO80 [Phytophthora citrophthora]|uniref:DNA helicase INO80 n=1 Tax=Phytophthora citrophthora TaxID=4793 RepID=A0AAD9H1K6_9STRA|nr:putative DNA helicase INO80 [Phytophthora citrophthora]
MGAPGDGHASALAMLAESSAARVVKSEEITLQTEETRRKMEMEFVQEKMDNARAKIGQSLLSIPTGREYDLPPDASEEHVYDALEKAYNSAFLVHPSENAKCFSGKKVDGHEGKLEAGSNEKDTGLREEKEHKVRELAKLDRLWIQVGTLKSMCLSTMKQHTASNAQNEAMDEAMTKEANVTRSGSEGSYKAIDNVKRQLPGSASADSVMLAESPPQSPMSAPNQTSSEDGFISTPEGKRGIRDEKTRCTAVEEDRIERADHLSLNEFLVTELEVYSSRLLDKRPPKRNSSGASDLAWMTGLQLFQDHQRALQDFDDEWKRTHADRYCGYKSTGSEQFPVPVSTIRANPFQQDGASPIAVGEWTALLSKVKASDTKSIPTETPRSLEDNAPNDSDEIFTAYKRGSNGIIVGKDDCQHERQQISTFMARVASSQSTSAFFVVIAAGSDLAQWEKALSSEQLIQLYPYWGSDEDRQNLLQLLSNEYFSSRSLSAHVLLTNYEVFMEDISVVTSLQCQLSIIDIPRQRTDRIAAIWPQLLSLRCRQRLLLCQPSFDVDVRKLLHLLVPEMFSSRRKLLAWNSAALPPHHVCAVCDVVKAFMLDSTAEACTQFMSRVELCTKRNSEVEATVLDTLDKQGIVRAIEPSIMLPVKRVLNRKSRSRPTRTLSGHVPAKGKLELEEAVTDPVDSQLTIKPPNAFVKKRRGSDSTPGSRQRIGRCGKCAGCLAEDCMKCGHCQDMKKYGGPGLRKQSCKNRKCLNPILWGFATRKRKRKSKRAESSDVKGDSEMDDDGSVAYSSVESDGESVSTATFGNDDSDDDAMTDSPRDLLLPASDTLLDDHLSLSDLSSRSSSGKSRVVRCGECDGCNAPDCMKCPHCLDMKKYGGPGLRKQTCKNRKCNAPKILVLNKAKGGHDQFVDEKGNVVYNGPNDNAFPGFYEVPDSSDRRESASPSAQSQLTVVQECERYVKPRLVFACVDCAARFISSRLLNFHSRVEHSQGSHAPTAFERKASRMFARAIVQNAIICAQPKLQDRSSQSPPLGYAKLQGQGFQYFFMEPFIVLGRMESHWRDLYTDIGFENVKGLPGGSVDCHIGNDSMIATKHAVISWDASIKSFVIDCLSVRTPISVNGRVLNFASPPTALSSRSLVQIGPSVFYFLLPKVSKAASITEESNTPRS